MKITINLPEKEDILTKGFLMFISRKGESWTKSCLGHYANMRGVYVHHSNEEIIYVGQTVKGKWGTFSERLRRELQETSSQANGLYRMLEEQKGQIKTVCFDLNEIDQLVSFPSSGLSKENKALIFEQLMIGVFQPKGNKNGVFKKVETDAEATTDVSIDE